MARQCRTLLRKKLDKKSDFVSPKCLSEMVNLLIPYEAALPTLLECSIIADTVPVGTAGCERTFNVMRRVKRGCGALPVMSDCRL